MVGGKLLNSQSSWRARMLALTSDSFSASVQRLIQVFENSRRAHPTAHAHCDHAITSVATPEFADNRRRQLRPGAAERMSESDRSAVRIHFLRIQPGFLDYSQRLRRERFVQLDHIDVRELQTRHL